MPSCDTVRAAAQLPQDLEAPHRLRHGRPAIGGLRRAEARRAGRAAGRCLTTKRFAHREWRKKHQAVQQKGAAPSWNWSGHVWIPVDQVFGDRLLPPGPPVWCLSAELAARSWNWSAWHTNRFWWYTLSHSRGSGHWTPSTWSLAKDPPGSSCPVAL